MIFDEIDILYSQIDNDLSIKEFNARSISSETDEFQTMLEREHNDQAYFLYIFTRLERRIQELFDELIKNKIATSTDDKEKNSWRLMKQKQLYLMDKVSFFAQAGGTDYNLIYSYKDKRDNVAHGKITFVDIPSTLVDMRRLYIDLDK